MLRSLINEILDLAKIESGTMAIDVSEVSFEALQDYVDRLFRQMADEKGLSFKIDLASDLPQSLATDEQRLRSRCCSNLLSNAFKFTEQGHGRAAHQQRAAGTGQPERASDRAVARVLGRRTPASASPSDKQKIIFEAFQQAEGGTSRRFGGTGLGLSISREIAELLGGEITVRASPGAAARSRCTCRGSIPARRSRAAPRSRRGRRAGRADEPTLASVRRPGATAGAARARAVARAQQDRRPTTARSSRAGDRVLLVIEDDQTFARTLLDSARRARLPRPAWR